MDFPRDLDERQRIMYEAQLRTNELLEQMLQILLKPTVVEPIKPPVNRAPQTKVKKTTPRRKVS